MEHPTERETRVTVTPGLFEPTEGRGQDAPPGVPFVWGVDVSSVRLSIAVESDKHGDEEWAEDVPTDTTRAVFTHSFTRATRKAVGERLAIVYSETLVFARMTAQRFEPEQVSVESPAMSQNRGSEPILTYATGAVVAALSMALPGVPVWMVPVSRWKLRAVGHGHASKDRCLEWAKDEFGARIEDEADAAGVCRAARLTVWEGLCDEKDVKRGAVPRGVPDALS